LVVGEFKRGKSTLLNALLGDDVLPRKVAECTAVVTLIRYGSRAEVQVRFEDGQVEGPITIDEFRRRYELRLEDSEDRNTAVDRFSRVDHAVLSYPLELCRHRVELVDSPGLGSHQTRSLRTQKFLPKADAVVFVLYAPQFLKEDESHFLEAVLLPMGLKNVFFVINGWNLIEDSVVRPEDADREREELETYIRQRLNPFCFIDGHDRSSERIFRVNALGALKARMRRPPGLAMLEESNVPAFEESLQRFLVEDRGRARTDATLGALRTASAEADRYIATQLALADRSVSEIEAERVALQPKLDRLRGIRQHVVGYLDSQSATLQDRLVISFQGHIRKLDEALPAEVDKLDLSEITKGSMVWVSLSDWMRRDENKFAHKVERCLTPQVRRLLERHFATWQQSVVKNEMQAVMIDVDKHLQEEAAEYQRVMREIEEQVGIHTSPLQIKELVARWLGYQEGSAGASRFALDAGGAFGDMSWVVGSIALDVAAEVLLHMASVWIPIVGVVITLVRLACRELTLRSQLKEKIVVALREGLAMANLNEATKIRGRIRDGFDGLKEKVSGNIDEEIALIDASMQAIIDRKKNREFSAQEERQRLDKARQTIAATVEQLVGALRPR
jgi:hypothetical protein